MTATEKYLQMNHNFIVLRDSIFNPDVDEEPEDEGIPIDPAEWNF